MSTTTENVEKFLGLAKDLSVADRYAIAMALLETIAESIGAPKAKGRKAKADGEPKATRAPTSWDLGRAAVAAAIKGVEGFKQPHVMKFASALKTESPEDWAEMEAEEMVEKYEAWLVDNSDVGSRTSGGSKASKAKEPKVELTEEEKAAKRKVAAEKRKATMAANKAAKAAAEASEESSKPKAKKESAKAKAAAEAAAEAVVTKATVEEEDGFVHMESWEHDFGEGAKTYGRYEQDGKVYIYETDGTTYLGELKGKKKFKLDNTVADPLLE